MDKRLTQIVFLPEDQGSYSANACFHLGVEHTPYIGDIILQ